MPKLLEVIDEAVNYRILGRILSTDLRLPRACFSLGLHPKTLGVAYPYPAKSTGSRSQGK